MTLWGGRAHLYSSIVRTEVYKLSEGYVISLLFSQALNYRLGY